jgi:penicillin amidase
MRIVYFLFSTIITIALIFLLDNKWGSIPALGRFLSPQQGFWQNAEPADHDFNEQLVFKNLKGQVNVYLDDRLVPHIFAEQDEDAYFVQGFLHAKFRLWQMEFQTHAAAGRVSEILGSNEAFLRYDREQRRLGMGYAAENAVKEMEANAETKLANDAYAAGVNEFINTLTESSLPIEYKLLGYKPEKWSNLKSALFLKMMSKDLAGFDKDLEFTNAKSVFDIEEMKKLFPEVSDSSFPIIPKGTAFAAPRIVPVKPASADSLYFKKDTTVKAVEIYRPNRNNGSNSWAVNGAKTASGAPILSNDPHLGLALPSIWYEMQISTPTMNVYGATFPGSPSVIIGFNDSIAFGFTNAQRDVKDYYQVRFKDDSKTEYWFNEAWQPTQLRIEEIKIRGAANFNDTVAYTVFGPVMYDQRFTSGDSVNKAALAVRWTAHDPSNEGLMWLKLNRANNYNDYMDAIKIFTCPGQNILFASKSGDIAITQQARFPARWEGQGLFIMPGEDSNYMWQGFIPRRENPHILNPVSGFIQSANQRPVDSTYPYFIPGNYISARGITIEKRLAAMQNITPKEMMVLQNDYYSVTASLALPLFFKYFNDSSLNEQQRNYLFELKKWNYNTDPDSRATTIYQAWMDSVENIIWSDEFAQVEYLRERPDEQTLLEALHRDSAFSYIDDINTADTETLQQQITAAFVNASAGLLKEQDGNNLIWWKHKNPSILHLLRNSVLPFGRIGIAAGGWGNTINAIKSTHGPSWRMVVHLTPTTEAYGIYPGGQSGNPGSRYYDNFINNWTVGEYYQLWMMKEEEKVDSRVKATLTFTNS